MIGPGQNFRSNYWSCPLSTGILQYESNLTILYLINFKIVPFLTGLIAYNKRRDFSTSEKI